MKGILPDANAEGHWERLRQLLTAEPWKLFWDALALAEESSAGLGLSDRTPDAELWHLCQGRQLILVTNNRNMDGPDSLEATLRDHNTPGALPVFTLANPDKVRTSAAHAHRVVERLLRYLLDIDNVRGAGRLYLP